MEAPCGSTGTLDATEINQVLSSPNYPAAPGANLRCRWLIDGNFTAVQIRFQHLSIGSADSAQCTNDRLEIQDVISVKYLFFNYSPYFEISKTFIECWHLLQANQNQEANGNLILNGDGASVVTLDQNRRIMIQVGIDVTKLSCS